jgi:hypothetical protein
VAPAAVGCTAQPTASANCRCILIDLGRWTRPLLGRSRRGAVIGAWGGIGVIGVALASTSLFVLVGSVIAGGGRGWDRPLVVTGLTAVGLGLAAVVLWERQASAPMLPLRHRGFVLVSVASLLMYSASFGNAGPSHPAAADRPRCRSAGSRSAHPPTGGDAGVPRADRWDSGDRIRQPSGDDHRVGAGTAAFTWLAALTRPGVGYPVLLPALIMVGPGYRCSGPRSPTPA